VRGFTRDINGKKVYIDHDITSIQDFISDEILKRYIAYDINIMSDGKNSARASRNTSRIIRNRISGDR